MSLIFKKLPVLSLLLLFGLLAQKLSAQYRVVTPTAPLDIASILVLAEKAASKVYIQLLVSSGDDAYQLAYTSSEFRITKGLNELSYTSWKQIDTIISNGAFHSLGYYQKVHQAQILLIQDQDTLFQEQFTFEVEPKIVRFKGSFTDSISLRINAKSNIHSLNLLVSKNDSSQNVQLTDTAWSTWNDYDSLQVFYDSIRIYITIKEKPASPSRLIFERVKEELPNVPVLKLNSSMSSVNGVLSDTNIANSALATPYAMVNNQTSFTVFGVPIKANLFGLYDSKKPLSDVLLGPASYFNMSFDTEAFKKLYAINPKSAALSDQLLQKNSEMTIDRMKLEKRKAELDAKAKGMVLNYVPDEDELKGFAQTKAQESVQTNLSNLPIDTSNFLQNDLPNKEDLSTDQLNWRERRELRKVTSSINQINKEQAELKHFQSSLDSLQDVGAELSVDQLPSALDDESVSKLVKRPGLKNIESLQIGNVSPSRMGSLQSSFFVELMGASVNYKVNDKLSVYGLAGQNKLTSFIPMAPLSVYEAGVSTTQKKLRLSLVASAEVSRNMNGFFQRNGRQLEFDTITSVLNQNLYLTAEYALLKSVLVGAEVVLPTSNFSSTFNPLGQREKLYFTYTNKAFGLSAYVENHPLNRYTEIDFGAMQDVVKYGSKVDFSFFKKAISMQLGYDYLFSGLSDTTSQGTNTQHGFNFNVNVAFENWPSLYVMYTPFSSANGFLEPVTGQFVQMTNQTELWSGVLTYQRPIGNFFYVFSANYQNVANSSVYSLNPDTPVYDGSFESARLTVMMRSKKHTFSINGIAIRGTAQDQIGASGIYKFGLNEKFTIGETSGYSLVNGKANIFTAALAEIKFKSFGFNLQAGSFFSNDNKPNPYARVGLSHTFN